MTTCQGMAKFTHHVDATSYMWKQIKINFYRHSKVAPHAPGNWEPFECTH
jgi:hypothetical protein